MTHNFRAGLQGELTFKLGFERAVVGRQFRHGEQQRPRGGTAWLVWGPSDGLLSLEHKVEGTGRCPGDLRTLARELWLHPYGRGAGQAVNTSAPVLSVSGLPKL